MRKRKTKNKPAKEAMSLKYSIRISGSVTSLSLRKNLVGLWLTLNSDDIKFGPGAKGKLNGRVQNFIYQCLGKWKGENGKGFSEFVSEMMVKDILEGEDYQKYEEILECI